VQRIAVLGNQCRDDLHYWVDANHKTALRILELMEAVMREPFEGSGKPEHLKRLGGNVWSRRISEVDRLVYEVFDDRVEFLQARYHYG
jgi:toxin YoeB